MSVTCNRFWCMRATQNVIVGVRLASLRLCPSRCSISKRQIQLSHFYDHNERSSCIQWKQRFFSPKVHEIMWSIELALTGICVRKHNFKRKLNIRRRLSLKTHSAACAIAYSINHWIVLLLKLVDIENAVNVWLKKRLDVRYVPDTIEMIARQMILLKILKNKNTQSQVSLTYRVL